jgi:hypothetical protein
MSPRIYCAFTFSTCSLPEFNFELLNELLETSYSINGYAYLPLCFTLSFYIAVTRPWTVLLLIRLLGTVDVEIQNYSVLTFMLCECETWPLNVD